MTCGEVYRQIMEKIWAGMNKTQAAQEVGVSRQYLHYVLNYYASKGDKIFENNKPFKGRCGTPPCHSQCP